ncbi:hypothetical protein [Novosphingobium taihuense]|uniref:Uncharacterized protein n=1 Tax=Novosphingobium taihuense TaxID=260085 RepID=A0A7W7A9B1_9SPHN|nr:hypothetical protein [Novosphingobium taihuense]MBB4612818.1 hypothetical protein [Novosphingobium taihuense]TWH80272.1 hypothetical protein IQ25_03732 [Novosphingobium taihuense]
MAETKSTYRFAAMLLVGSVLAVAALVVTGLEKAKAPSDQASIAATVAKADDEDFRKWADEGDVADGKGRLIGEIEHNGKMVELRELPRNVDPDGPQPDDAEPPADSGPGDPAIRAEQ